MSTATEPSTAFVSVSVPPIGTRVLVAASAPDTRLHHMIGYVTTYGEFGVPLVVPEDAAVEYKSDVVPTHHLCRLPPALSGIPEHIQRLIDFGRDDSTMRFATTIMVEKQGKQTPKFYDDLKPATHEQELRAEGYTIISRRVEIYGPWRD